MVTDKMYWVDQDEKVVEIYQLLDMFLPLKPVKNK